MRSSLFFLSVVLITSLASCAPSGGINGDSEGTYSPAVQGPIINSSDAIQLMSDKTGIFQQDQTLIAYYSNREPTQSPAWQYFHNLIRRERPFQDDIDRVLQLVDKLVNASAPDGY